MGTPALTLEKGDRIKIVVADGAGATESLYVGTGETGDYIVVPLCEERGSPAPEESIQCLCLCNAQMIEFASTLLEVIDHPLRLWRIQAPKTVETFELRDSKRTRCTVSATFEAIDKGLVLVGIIRDISKNGARCVFQSNASAQPASLQVDDAVTLRCEFPGIPGEQVAPAKITDIAQTDSELSIGMRFVEPVWWVPPYH